MSSSIMQHGTTHNISLSLLVPKHHPTDTPFTPALPLAVDIPIDDLGKGDIYIDDSIFVTPDIGNNVERVAKAVPLAINTVARPVHDLEPLPRKSIISQKKFLAKACFEENKIVLGWQLNTRSFIIHLPHKKKRSLVIHHWFNNAIQIIIGKTAAFFRGTFEPRQLHHSHHAPLSPSDSEIMLHCRESQR